MKDIIIVGSGPAGLSAAVYAKRAGLDILVIEKEYEGTGQIAYSIMVDNYPGLPGIDGFTLGQQFRDHAVSLGTPFYEGEVSQLVSVDDRYWKVILQDGSVMESRSIVYCGGAGYRKLLIPGEETYIGKGVSYCATCDGAFFANKTVAVIGGGDTALDDALYLSGIAQKVYLIHRRDTFRGTAANVEKVKHCDNIELILKAQVTEIQGQDVVQKLILLDQNDNIRDVEVSGVFVAIGMIPNAGPLQNYSICDDNGYIKAEESCRTAVKGLYAAGDVRQKRLRQVVTAVADGANAVTSILEDIIR